MNKKELLYLRAKREYYNSDEPIMSDLEFDSLEQELMDDGSTVVNKVGAEPTGALTKVKHSVPMKSLRKLKIDSDDFDKEIARWVLSNNINGIEGSIKLDGNACKLIYDNKGNFMCATSRGNGEVGFDISDKLVEMGIPLKFDFNHSQSLTTEIYGEVVVPLSTFEEKYAEEYKNARNFVSGRLAIDLSKYDKEDRKYHLGTFRDLHFVPFDMAMVNIEEESQLYMTISRSFIERKFNHNLDFRIFQTNKGNWKRNLNHFIEELRDGKIEIDYLYDGIVLRDMNGKNRSLIGETDHHPKWAVALKYESESATTQLIDIEWNIGTNRKLAPVGILEPVELMGTTVQRVSLANLNTMIEKDIVPNSMLTIQKSGDIIPFVISSTPPPLKYPTYADNKYKLITEYSDITMDELEWDEDDPYNVRYTGESDEVAKRKLHKGIKVLDIDNIGEATVDLLYDSGIKTIFDLFDLDKFNKDYLIESGNFKDGRALTIILIAVWDKSSFDYWRVINSLQVEGCGKTMSKELAKYYSGVEYDFSGLEKQVIDTMISKSDEHADVYKLENLLLSHHFTINYPEEKAGQTQGSIKTFEMTGSPKEFGWKTKKEFTNELSASVEHTKLTKDTDFLITDDLTSNSGKMKKAKKYGTQIVDYKDFYEQFGE